MKFKIPFFGKRQKHKHNWQLVAINMLYYTTYTDRDYKQWWNLRFYKCICGDRHFESNYHGNVRNHTGIYSAKLNWLEVGVLPPGSIENKME